MARLSKLSRSIAGKTALITGAASGMGRATAHLFADEGAKVAVIDLNAEGVEKVVSEIRDAGGNARGWQLDVADKAEIEKVVQEVADHFGGLDILINNAGFSHHMSVEHDEFEANWARHMDVMLTAHVRMVRAALPYLKKSGAGRIVNIASTEGLGATPGISPYTSAKHGVIGLTRSLAVELPKYGITVNCICPGAIHTGITARIKDEHKQIFSRRRIPLNRYGEPEEVAHATLSLVLPAASYINGVALPVDAGLTIKNA
ncbi:MAG: 3-oxoacyl-ACP reductase [Sneathiella sp.]|jgi:3-oxoacyl-[acyl-carrier protein] reductase|uniref:SDR family NAD(P)-dependent oxidoreductase n=1 Tax=Sneathiella sp. TaxID=1964365 RepID=UPI000C3D9C69|nr:SDR family NAD(P)-dependent oxidoreductase [Sneathiella sp.]MAL78583.1 3-oxoacyl-ACP reductase [Sneathiella sp.]